MTSATTLPAHRPLVAEPARARRHATRDTSIDTAVGILIISVVFSHASGRLAGATQDVVNQLLFMFHMPAFVFLSGYLTRRSSSWSPRQLALRLLVPFAIFQVLHIVARSIKAGEFNAPTTLVAAWTTWYLLSLFSWRLAAPWLARIPWVVPLSILVSLGAGTVAVIGPHLSIGRTLGFLPFFVMGLMWREEWLERIRAWKWRMVALAVLVLAAVVAVLTVDDVGRSVLLFHNDFESVGLSNGEGLVIRAGALVMGTGLTLAFLSLSGWTSKLLARIGAASLVVYLLHPLALYPVNSYSDALPELAWLAVIAVSAVLFAALVTRPSVIRLTRPLMDYRWWSERKVSG